MVLVFFTRVNSLKTETAVVFLDTITNNRYTFTEPLPTRVTITLRGEESEIKKVNVDDIEAYIDASFVDQDGIYQLPIQINQNRIFNKTKNVEITVAPIAITATIEETITKYLRIESVITGIPAHGYELNSRFLNPRILSVSGPKSHLEEMEFIQTDAVDVTGKNSDFLTRIRLNKSDPLLSFPEGEFVEFQGIITEASAVKVLENVNIAIKDLIEGLDVVSEIPQISVNVEGKLLSLQNFTKNNISLTVSLKDITSPGIYELPITYWTPKYAHVYDKSRDTITLDVRRIGIKP